MIYVIVGFALFMCGGVFGVLLTAILAANDDKPGCELNMDEGLGKDEDNEISQHYT